MVKLFSFVGEFRELGVGDKDKTRGPNKREVRVTKAGRTHQ